MLNLFPLKGHNWHTVETIIGQPSTGPSLTVTVYLHSHSQCCCLVPFCFSPFPLSFLLGGGHYPHCWEGSLPTLLGGVTIYTVGRGSLSMLFIQYQLVSMDHLWPNIGHCLYHKKWSFPRAVCVSLFFMHISNLLWPLFGIISGTFFFLRRCREHKIDRVYIPTQHHYVLGFAC